MRSDETTSVPRLIGQRGVAAHHAVHTQSAAEYDIALDARGRANQAVDPVLRLARRLNIIGLPCSLQRHGVGYSPLELLVDPHLHTRLRRCRPEALHTPEVPERQPVRRPNVRRLGNSS
jgi:hypothetical protein